MKNIYENNGFKFIISNHYDKIICIVNDYFKNVQIPCKYCRNKRSFKTEPAYRNHVIGFHRLPDPWDELHVTL